MRNALAIVASVAALACLASGLGDRTARPAAPAQIAGPATYALIGPTPGVAGSLDVLDYDLSIGDCVEAMREVRGSACEVER